MGAASAVPGAGGLFGVLAALAAFAPVGVAAARRAACGVLSCGGFVGAGFVAAA